VDAAAAPAASCGQRHVTRCRRAAVAQLSWRSALGLPGCTQWLGTCPMCATPCSTTNGGRGGAWERDCVDDRHGGEVGSRARHSMRRKRGIIASEMEAQA
jgi:hypothetical protein